MRRKDREITDFAEIIAAIKTCEVCHLALFDEEYPYVLPLNFGFEVIDSQVILYFHGADKGKKHDLIHNNNHAAFAMETTQGIITGKDVDICECSMEFESILGTGIIDYLENEEEKLRALDKIIKQYLVSEGQDYHLNNQVVPKTKVFRLRANSLTAKRRNR